MPRYQLETGNIIIPQHQDEKSSITLDKRNEDLILFFPSFYLFIYFDITHYMYTITSH